MRISDWSSDVCSSDLAPVVFIGHGIVDPASGRDDIGSADLKGAVALRFAEPPPEYAAGNRPVPDLRSRRALYQSRGTVADIAIKDSEDAEFTRPQRGYRLGLMRFEEIRPGIGVRSEERRVGKECVRTCRSWWSQ